MVGLRGDDFLDCHGWLTKEPYWIRYGGWAKCSYPAGHLSVAVYLYNRETGEKMSHTTNYGDNLDYVETPDNLEAHPPPGDYYTHTRAWTLQPSHDVLHDSPRLTWP
jgi:hypothetical protein